VAPFQLGDHSYFQTAAGNKTTVELNGRGQAQKEAGVAVSRWRKEG